MKQVGPEAIFTDALAEGRFEIQRCLQCTRYVFYPRKLCPYCGSTTLEFGPADGRGTVYACSVARGGTSGDSYNFSIVELLEGPRMMSRVVDIPPGDVFIGQRVRAFVGSVGDQPAVLFRPAAAGPAGAPQ